MLEGKATGTKNRPTNEEVLFRALVTIDGIKDKDERKKRFTEILCRFLREHAGEIIETNNIFTGKYAPWTRTLLRILAEIQRDRLIEGYELSINSDYSRFRIFDITDGIKTKYKNIGVKLEFFT